MSGQDHWSSGLVCNFSLISYTGLFVQAASLAYSKQTYTPTTSKISSSPETIDRFQQTWYVPSAILVHHNLYKSLLLVDLDLFYGIVKFGLICFSTGKNVKIGFFRQFCRL